MLRAYAQGLAALITVAVCTWVLSLYRRNVAIVDSVWSVMFALAAAVYTIAAPSFGTRAVLVLALTTMWALRLSVYITWRNWGHGEDRRYVAIRARNQPYFEWKSLYLVFLLQALLAAVVSLPLLGSILSEAPLSWLDLLGTTLWLVGMVFEAGGDWQLSRFKANPENRGKVMDRGFWRLSRHPNYFGEFCVWWGFYLIALSAGALWSIAGPLLMSLLLLRVSGVTLLEKDIATRRPQYADYVRRTNAFFPGLPKV